MEDTETVSVSLRSYISFYDALSIAMRLGLEVSVSLRSYISFYKFIPFF